MKKILLLISSCVALLLPTSVYADSINVMSFNIRLDNPDDAEDNWRHRKDNVAALIRFQARDRFACDYLGPAALPKDAGTIGLHRLRHRTEIE